MQFDNYRVRLLQGNDLDAYYQLIDRNRDRLLDFFTNTVSRTRTLDDTKAYLEENMLKIENRLYFPFVVEDMNSNAFAGFMDVKRIEWKLPKAELGCFMDAGYAGTGIATKAFRLFTDHLFSEYGFNKLFLRTHPGNIPARKLVEKCGFESEGLLRKDHKTTAGEIVDLVYYGKLSARML